MRNLKMKLGAAMMTLSLSLPVLAYDDTRSDEQETSDSTAMIVGHLQACGQAFGNPYANRASKLESLLYNYLTNLGYRTNAAKKKIEVFRHILKQEMTYSPYDLGNVKNLDNIKNWGAEEWALSRKFSLDSAESLKQRRDSKEFKAECESSSSSGDAFTSILRTSINESQSARASVNRGSSCGLSADYYQERFRVTGKMSDMTCYIKAGRRELDAAAND